MASESEDFQGAEAEAARKLQGEVAAIQGRLLGRGLFRGFLEEHMGWGREAQMGCSSPAFVAAASGVLRWALHSVVRCLGLSFTAHSPPGSGPSLRREGGGFLGDNQPPSPHQGILHRDLAYYQPPLCL